MIERLTGFHDNVLAFACRGRVTRQDYETVLIPVVEEALKAHGRVSLYYEVQADFAGVEPGAVIDDIKVGVEHFNRWDRLALVSDVEWIRDTARAIGFLLPGRLRVFRLGEAPEARNWINDG